MRARKEGGPGWNSVDSKHLVKTFPDEEEAEVVRQGFNPDRPEKKIVDETHALLDCNEGDGDGETAMVDEVTFDQVQMPQPWGERRYGDDVSPDFGAEREAWGGGGTRRDGKGEEDE